MGDNNKKLCGYCRSPLLDEKACVCKECGRHQKWYIQYFSNFGILISFLLLLVSISQLLNACSDRSDARRTLAHAQAAEANIRTLALSMIDITLTANKYPPNLYYSGEEGYRKKLDELYKKANEILRQHDIPKEKQPLVVDEVQRILQGKISQ